MGRGGGARRTEFGAVPAKVEAGEDELAEAEFRTEGGEEADGEDGDEVDQDDDERGVEEAEVVDRDRDDT